MPTSQRAVRHWRMGAGAAVGVVALTLAAFGSTGSAFAQDFAGQTLVVQHGAITSNKEGFEAYYNALAEEFTKQTGATIEYTTSAMSINEQMPQIMATHSGPDVIAASSMGAAFASDAFVHFSDEDWAVMGGLEQFPPGQLGGSGPPDGPYSSVPGYNNPYAMIYNTKLFEKAGLTYPPTTWTEFIDYAQKINDPANGVYGTGFDPGDGANQDSWKTPFYFMNGYGGDSLYAPDRSPTINSEASVAAYDFWFSWYTKFKIVDPNSLSWQNPQMQAAFAEGKIGMLPAVNSSIAALSQKGAVGNDFAFAPLPVTPYGMDNLPEGGGPPSRLAQAGWYVGSYANKDLALQFLKITLLPEMQLKQFEDAGRLPVTIKGVELALASPKSATLTPFLEVIRDFQQPVPLDPWWNLAQTGLVAMGTQLASRIATGEEIDTDDIRAALTEVQTAVSQQ